MTLRLVVLITAAAVVIATGCDLQGAAPSLPASALPASGEGTSRACQDVPLRDPDGQLVFLTGRWIGSGDPNALPAPSVFLVRQTNSCLTWVGLSTDEGEALGASWVETFSGQIGPDFTVAGLWEAVPDGGRGAITVEIAFVPVGDGYEVEMGLVASTGDIHRTKGWVREAAD